MPRRWQKTKDRPAPLWDPPLERGGLASTSIAAAASMRELAPTIRERILRFIRSRADHGSTIEEATIALVGIKIQPACPSFNSLWHAGLIRNTGRTRLTTSGRSTGVWVATDQGGQA